MVSIFKVVTLTDVYKRQLITITHNLEEKLLKKYDEIIYMKNGNVKEQGYFQELVNTSSCFSEYLHLKE